MGLLVGVRMEIPGQNSQFTERPSSITAYESGLQPFKQYVARGM